eukprot:795719-Prorocentrum_minimum.AAC.1
MCGAYAGLPMCTRGEAGVRTWGSRCAQAGHTGTAADVHTQGIRGAAAPRMCPACAHRPPHVCTPAVPRVHIGCP